jgi:hypothetical protein
MARPKPGAHGDLAHLRHGSIRNHIANGMRLLIITSEGPAHPQYHALLAGGDVVVSADQIRGFGPEGKWPRNIDRHDAFVLTADDRLLVRRRANG